MKGKSNAGVRPCEAYARPRTQARKVAIKRKTLSEEEKSSILACHSEGMSNRSIATLMGVGEWQVRVLVQRFKAGDSLGRKDGSGRPRITSPSQDQKIIIDIKRNPRITAKEILKENPDIKASERTVIGRIHESGEFGNYFTLKKPLITEKNRIRRLKWARAHKDWSVEQWRSVLWTDESPFQLRFRMPNRVWRRHADRNRVINYTPTMKQDPKIMVWGAFSYNGVGNLFWIKQIMNKEIYHDILREQMLPSKLKLFGDGNFIFQQDNDPKHTAKINKDWVTQNNIVTFDWPSQSPDLNPIENLWSILDRRLKHRKCHNVTELFEAISEGWNSLPVDLLHTLVDSMPKRCLEVIKSKGWPTKY